MKRNFVVLLFVSLVGLSAGDIHVKICNPRDLAEQYRFVTEIDDPNDLPDPNAPPEKYPNTLMVGQTISFVVASDVNDLLWSGGFFLKGNNRGMGTLSARGKDPNSRDWSGSHLPDAGNDAFVSEWKDSAIWGFDLYNDVAQKSDGDWFVIDYTAKAEGWVNIGFYDYEGYSWSAPDPNVILLFNQIPTRDFNNDNMVNLIDFHVFAQHWNASYTDPNDFEKTDISGDGTVDLVDLVAFSEYWLWGAPAAPEPELIAAPAMPDPNLFYSIVDANGLSEITLTVGDSVILYIDQNSLPGAEEIAFNTETHISDPNLGWIDNDPEGSAVILTYPREDLFDYIGPGQIQPEGIEFYAVNFGGIQDGPLAAFVYTATDIGDVTLDLVNYSYWINAGLNPILIHQVAPPVDAVQVLQNIWASGELAETTTEQEWDAFITSVKESQTNDPNSVSQ